MSDDSTVTVYQITFEVGHKKHVVAGDVALCENKKHKHISSEFWDSPPTLWCISCFHAANCLCILGVLSPHERDTFICQECTAKLGKEIFGIAQFRNYSYGISQYNKNKKKQQNS